MKLNHTKFTQRKKTSLYSLFTPLLPLEYFEWSAGAHRRVPCAHHYVNQGWGTYLLSRAAKSIDLS